ncbi:MAG: hypothetical protein ACR2LE_03300 [Nocardioidaceae bacterium]
MARLRRVEPGDSPLPPEIATGPSHWVWGSSFDPPEDARMIRQRRWRDAGRRWSRANGRGDWGWERLLSAMVREETSIKARVKIDRDKAFRHSHGDNDG